MFGTFDVESAELVVSFTGNGAENNKSEEIFCSIATENSVQEGWFNENAPLTYKNEA